jgi:hypothetical protein
MLLLLSRNYYFSDKLYRFFNFFFPVFPGGHVFLIGGGGCLDLENMLYVSMFSSVCDVR